MSNPTPGPWFTDKEGYRVLAEDNAKGIVVVCATAWNKAGRNFEAQANAKLIASAPEMLTKLADQRAEIEKLERLRVHCPDCGADYAATGIEAGCPCKLRAEVERLTELCDTAEALVGENRSMKEQIERLQAEVARLQYENGEAATAIKGFGNRLANMLPLQQLADQRAEIERLTIALENEGLLHRERVQSFYDQRAVIDGLVEALMIYVDAYSGFHDENCSLDDTCDCSGKAKNDKINAALEAAKEAK